MNISPISFRGDTDFQQMISKPQSYQKQEVPAAATSLSKSHKKESSAGKKFLGFVAVAAAVTAAIAFAAKNNKLNPEQWKDGKIKEFVTKHEIVKKGLDKVEKFGNKVTEYAGKAKDWVTKTAIPKVKDFFSQASEKVEAAAENAGEAAQQVIENPPV